MTALNEYLQHEITAEMGTELVPQHEQAAFAETTKMMQQKYGLIAPQLTDEALAMIAAERLTLAILEGDHDSYK